MSMKKILLSVACAVGGLIFAASAFAVPPKDGQLVKLDAEQMWHLSYFDNLPVQNQTRIAEKLTAPSISPDGQRVVLFERGLPGEPNVLHEWSVQNPRIRELSRSLEFSNFITWDDDENISIREQSRPFFRVGAKLRFSHTPKALKLRERKPLVESNYVVYDQDDVIILESKKTQTLQAISDPAMGRYFAPILSPDEKFVVYSSLSSGIFLFDIEQNAVVFIGAHGSVPAFSPDGRYLIYADTGDDGHDYTRGDLILLDLRLKSYRVIANPQNEIRLNATLSRDAKAIAYETSDGKVWRGELEIGN